MIRFNRLNFNFPRRARPVRRTYRLSSAALVFRMPDVDRTCRWYAENLGFSVTRLEGDGESGWAVLSFDDVRLLVQPMCPEECCLRWFSSSRPTIRIHILVAGIEAYQARLGPCLRLLRPSKRRPQGVATLLVEDCNGMLIELNEVEDMEPTGP